MPIIHSLTQTLGFTLGEMCSCKLDKFTHINVSVQNSVNERITLPRWKIARWCECTNKIKHLTKCALEYFSTIYVLSLLSDGWLCTRISFRINITPKIMPSITAHRRLGVKLLSVAEYIRKKTTTQKLAWIWLFSAKADSFM